MSKNTSKVILQRKQQKTSNFFISFQKTSKCHLNRRAEGPFNREFNSIPYREKKIEFRIVPYRVKKVHVLKKNQQKF